MALVLYGVLTSSNLRRVLVVILEKEQDYTLEKVDLVKKEHKQASYVAKQPFGQVPYFEDPEGNVKLYQSRAIVRYVAEKYEGVGPSLLGKTLQERAQVNMWLENESMHFTPAFDGIFKEVIIKPRGGQQPDEAKLTEAVKQAANVLDVYEAHLASTKNEFLAGNFLSIADLSHLPRGYMLWECKRPELPALFESRPHVGKWFKTVYSRPSWQKILSNSPPLI